MSTETEREQLARLMFETSHDEPWEQGMDGAREIYREEAAAVIAAGWRPRAARTAEDERRVAEIRARHDARPDATRCPAGVKLTPGPCPECGAKSLGDQCGRIGRVLSQLEQDRATLLSLGTNLFSATQAEAMVRHMIAEMPSAATGGGGQPADEVLARARVYASFTDEVGPRAWLRDVSRALLAEVARREAAEQQVGYLDAAWKRSDEALQVALRRCEAAERERDECRDKCMGCLTPDEKIEEISSLATQLQAAEQRLQQAEAGRGD